MVKLASARYLDELPTSGDESGAPFAISSGRRAFSSWRKRQGSALSSAASILRIKRVIRLPRHGASCPVGTGRKLLSRSSDQSQDQPPRGVSRRAWRHPERLWAEGEVSESMVPIDLDQGLSAVRAALTQHPVGTGLLLSGLITVARDIAHARIRERLQAGEPMPDYFADAVIYYAGPAKTPEGLPSGSFGPTTAQRMDPYVPLFQPLGGSLVTLAKGNRSEQVTQSCQEHGGSLSGLDRWTGGAPWRGLHYEDRGDRHARARHGGRPPDHGQGLPGGLSLLTTRGTTSSRRCSGAERARLDR